MHAGSESRPYGPGRMTAQRKAIAVVASEMSGAFTVEELVSAVRRRFPVAGATATVYRAVSAMVDSGYLEKVGARDGGALYIFCADDGHHHHLICEKCGSTTRTSCPIDPTAPGLEGFTVTRHEVTLYGVCARCSLEKRA